MSPDLQAIIEHAEYIRQSLPPDTHRAQLGQLCSVVVKLAQAIETRRRIEPAPTNLLEPCIVACGEDYVPFVISTADESGDAVEDDPATCRMRHAYGQCEKLYE